MCVNWTNVWVVFAPTIAYVILVSVASPAKGAKLLLCVSVSARLSARALLHRARVFHVMHITTIMVPGNMGEIWVVLLRLRRRVAISRHIMR